MLTFTIAQFNQLLKNGSPENRDKDHPPVVKIFVTGTGATWLLTEIDHEDHDLAFGLCDLGLGFPELGFVRLSEIERLRNWRLGRHVEIDKCFKGVHPISIYDAAAYIYGAIVEENEYLIEAMKKLNRF